MALKKSQRYSSLWESCDLLRGGMDASQYKDYVLVLLFIKYASDKYAGAPYAPITIPAGACFNGIVALKGKSDIGDQINKKIIGPLARENKLSDTPDFNDPTKLGSGREMYRISQARTRRVQALSKRYATPLPKLAAEVDILAAHMDDAVFRTHSYMLQFNMNLTTQAAPPIQQLTVITRCWIILDTKSFLLVLRLISALSEKKYGGYRIKSCRKAE